MHSLLRAADPQQPTLMIVERKQSRCFTATDCVKTPFMVRLSCYVDVKSLRHRTSYVLKFPDQRETCCYTWHGTRPSH